MSASPVSRADAVPAPEDRATVSDLSADLARALRAQRARSTLGLSPVSMTRAYADWWLHLAGSTDKQGELMAALGSALVTGAGLGVSTAFVPPPSDRRFTAPQWRWWPYDAISRSFLLQEQWWRDATTGVPGVSAHHEQVATFFVQQWLDMFSPSNFLLTNPRALAETAASGGANLLRGAAGLMTDVLRMATGGPAVSSTGFRPGHEVAVTPGKVVFRNRLIEVIQYAPQTPTVFAEPLLIVPSWIMKFYILDLSPANSLVRYLVGRGHTVFMVSWKNPDAGDRDLGMDAYLKLGVMAAFDAVCRAMPERRVQALGYCLGGTLLAIAAAAMARAADRRLVSLTLLASEVDFSEPGPLGLFIDESELDVVDDVMAEKGYLQGQQMAGAFALLNARDVVWSRIEHDYLLGRASPRSDLIAWNADATRMPYRQHHEYLRGMYLHNDLAEGRYEVDGRPVALAAITVPVFALGTLRDSVAPWRSVYKMARLTDTDFTFCLSSGGHNVGIVNPPGAGVKSSHQWARRLRGDAPVDADTWAATTASHDGSWWPVWEAWLAARGGARVMPPEMGACDGADGPMDDAPGRYVRVT